MTELEDLTRLVDKAVHKSMSEVSKLSHIERNLTEQYNAAIKENRLMAGKIMYELEPFESRTIDLYHDLNMEKSNPLGDFVMRAKNEFYKDKKDKEPKQEPQ